LLMLPIDSTSASKINDQQSPIRNLEHRFSNILINRVRVASSRTSIRIFSERCSRLRIGDCRSLNRRHPGSCDYSQCGSAEAAGAVPGLGSAGLSARVFKDRKPCPSCSAVAHSRNR
jgi:hypothetical protein